MWLNNRSQGAFCIDFQGQILQCQEGIFVVLLDVLHQIDGYLIHLDCKFGVPDTSQKSNLLTNLLLVALVQDIASFVLNWNGLTVTTTSSLFPFFGFKPSSKKERTQKNMWQSKKKLQASSKTATRLFDLTALSVGSCYKPFEDPFVFACHPSGEAPLYPGILT